MKLKSEYWAKLKLVFPLKPVIFSALLVSITSANAEISISSFPYEQKFETNDYASQMVRVTGGATHTWLPSGGWRDSGGAKITAPNSNDSDAGIGAINFQGSIRSVNQINVRFLVYHGSTWQELAANNKVIILDGVDRSQRPMIISRDTGATGEEYVAYGACAGTTCNYKGGGLRPDNSDTFRIGNPPLAREAEWISVELEANVAEAYIKVYIYTQDGVISGEYVRQHLYVDGNANPASPPGDTSWSRLDLIGGYLHGSVQANDPNNYFILDEVKISDSYIGPPAGFLSDPPPKGPTLVE